MRIDMSSAESKSGQSGRRDGIGRSAIIYALSLLAALIVGEIALRVVGIRPWQLVDPNIAEVEPGGRFYTNDATLGFVLLPGKFKVILQDGFSFETTHLSDTQRITGPEDPGATETPRDEIWIFGGSFAYGFSLNDEETFPWLLQEKFPEYRVVNFGVTGYGTLHSYIQFVDALEDRRPPKAVILAYASFHDIRNTLSRKRRKTVAPYAKLVDFSLPYAVVDAEDKLGYLIDEVKYRELPLMRYSALVHFLEIAYNNIVYSSSDGHAITGRIVREMDALSEKAGAELIVAGIAHDPSTSEALERFAADGIPTVDISVDLSIPEHTNLPHDAHPSALANRQYASKLESFLRETYLPSTK